MSLKLRLTVMNFLQFFVWGAWLITIGVYWFQNRHWSGAQFGAIFSTMGIASLFMPTLMGIVADKWINAEKLYGLLHLGSAAMLFMLPTINDPGTFFWAILLTMICYMPTISLERVVSYNAIKEQGLDLVRDYPPIRVWGTIGFIAGTWTTSLLGFEASSGQFHVAAASALLLGLYAFSLPPCPPKLDAAHSKTLADQLGLSSFVLFKDAKLAIFFIFAMLLGAALQLTNAYGGTFLHDFDKNPSYKDLFAVQHSGIIISISQVSETLFILAIPFFLKRFGIKTVMLMSMIAWTLRFGMFAFGDPASLFGLSMIILSCIVYGMAFDFFNISGSLFVEGQCDPKIRASAQGLFMLMTNGVGAVLGSSISGVLIDKYFTAANGDKDWFHIWMTFAAYALVTAIAFAVLFKHKHEPEAMAKAQVAH